MSHLVDDEDEFWRDFIREYLEPKDKGQHEDKMKEVSREYSYSALKNSNKYDIVYNMSKDRALHIWMYCTISLLTLL